MPEDIEVGEETTYYGYLIAREGETEYRLAVYCDDFQSAKNIIKRCLEAGIIEWPTETAGRTKKEVKHVSGMDERRV